MSFIKNFMFLDQMLEGVYLVDKKRTILFWNKAAEILTGYSSSDVIGRKCFDNILMHVDKDGNSLCPTSCPLKKTILDGQSIELSIYLRHKQGHRVPVIVRSIPIMNDNGLIEYTMEVFMRGDPEINFKQIQDLAQKAFTDSLTGLPNKDYIDNKFKTMLASNFFNEKNTLGVFLIELKNLREINETYSIDAANDAIKIIAKTIVENIQPGNLVARLNGSRFIIITDLDKKSTMLNWSNKLLTLIKQSKMPAYEDFSFEVCIAGVVVKLGENIDFIYNNLEKELKKSRETQMNISIQD